MSDEEAMDILDDLLMRTMIGDIENVEGYDMELALRMGIEALEKQTKIESTLKEAEELHPYAVVGERETYSDYNQGWQDAVEYINRSWSKEE